jgi:hypothetical protein
LAGAWAVLQTLGDEGYASLAGQAFAAVDAIVAGLSSPLSLVAAPDSTLLALATDGSCDPFTICDEMAARGWFVQPQMSYAGRPATLHLSVSASTPAAELLLALSEAVAASVAVGPVAVDPDVVAFIEALDPTALTDDDFDGLLAASGLVGESAGVGLSLPDRMAPVNAMLDVASPAMREALLVAFLDRLSRPVRSQP